MNTENDMLRKESLIYKQNFKRPVSSHFSFNYKVCSLPVKNELLLFVSNSSDVKKLLRDFKCGVQKTELNLSNEARP